MEMWLQMFNVIGEVVFGYWLVFWVLGESFCCIGNWLQVGEFDIMENVNGFNLVWGILYCGVLLDGLCGEFNGIGQYSFCVFIICQGGFYIYVFEWDCCVVFEVLCWYLDGQFYGVIICDCLLLVIWQEIIGQCGYFLLFNVVMGGDFVYVIFGGCEILVLVIELGYLMVVDYVVVWMCVGLF